MHEFSNLIGLYHCTDIPGPAGVSAEVTADNTSIRVPGDGHVRVCLCVLTLWELTTNLREALWWCTQWTIQQQPVPPCPTSSATQSTPSGFVPQVVKRENQVPAECFLYQQEVCRLLFSYSSLTFTVTFYYPCSPSHSHWVQCSCHKCLKCPGIVAVD